MNTQDLRNFIDLACQVLRYNKRIFTDEFMVKINNTIGQFNLAPEELEVLAPFLNTQHSLSEEKTEKLIETLQRLKSRPVVLHTIAGFL